MSNEKDAQRVKVHLARAYLSTDLGSAQTHSQHPMHKALHKTFANNRSSSFHQLSINWISFNLDTS